MTMFRRGLAVLAGIAATLALPVLAQVETIDPNAAYTAPAVDPVGDSPPAGETGADYAIPIGGEAPAVPADASAQPSIDAGMDPAASSSSSSSSSSADPAAATPAAGDGSTTYQQDDLVGAAEGVFGKGAEGLARIIEDMLKKQGEPNAYIVGREGGGAFIFGVRYGSGTLYHKVEGQQPVYWTGPSLGLDVGANAGNTFVLVYNLYDTADLYKRFGAAEGQAYLVGGFNASYLREGDTVLIPIRMGAGLRLGINAGYMKFSRKQKWLPF